LKRNYLINGTKHVKISSFYLSIMIYNKSTIRLCGGNGLP